MINKGKAVAAGMGCMLLVAGCSGGSSSAPSSAAPGNMMVIHDGHPLSPCTGMDPITCVHSTSPDEIIFVTVPVDHLDAEGNYRVHVEYGTARIVSLGNQTDVGNCPVSDGSPCLDTDGHTLIDTAGSWDIEW